MSNDQARIIELLREAHLIAYKEIERLNLRIAELETQHHDPLPTPIEKPQSLQPPSSVPKQGPVAMMNEHQVANFLNMSVASMRRWRTFRNGPKFMKIGSAVRYRREDVDAWLSSCSQLR